MSEEKITIKRPDGKKIVGIVAGAEEGKRKPALISCHGFTGFKDQKHIRYSARKVAESGFVTFRFDGINGMGESDGDVFDCNTTDYLIDLETIFDYVEKLDFIDTHNIHLFGSSWGGMVVYNFKRKNECQSIILFEPVFFWERANGHKNIDQWEKDGFYIKHSRSRKIDIKIGYNYYADGLNYDEVKAVRDIAVPVLLIQGGGYNDNLPVEFIEGIVKNLRVKYEIKYLPDTPHSSLNSEQAERLSQAILDWLNKF